MEKIIPEDVFINPSTSFELFLPSSQRPVFIIVCEMFLLQNLRPQNHLSFFICNIDAMKYKPYL